MFFHTDDGILRIYMGSRNYPKYHLEGEGGLVSARKKGIARVITCSIGVISILIKSSELCKSRAANI